MAGLESNRFRKAYILAELLFAANLKPEDVENPTEEQLVLLGRIAQEQLQTKTWRKPSPDTMADIQQHLRHMWDEHAARERDPEGWTAELFESVSS